jgi:hypothetical protein
MRNILAILGAAVVTFAVIGYFLDWYKIHPTPDHQVNIDVNASKIVDDVKQESKEITNHLQEKKKDGTPQQEAPSTPNANPMPSGPGAVVVRPSNAPSTTPTVSPWDLP